MDLIKSLKYNLRSYEMQNDRRVLYAKRREYVCMCVFESRKNPELFMKKSGEKSFEYVYYLYNFHFYSEPTI